MLNLQIHLADLRGRWLADGGSLRCGESYLAPYLHSAVVPSAFDDGERLALLLVEGSSSDPHPPFSISACSKEGYCSYVNEAARHWGDTLLVEINREGPRFEITAGYAGAAPVYLALEGNTLYGNHDFHAIAQEISARHLDTDISAHFLAGSLPYGSRTLLQGVSRLTERARARWQDNKMEVIYPPAAPDLLPAKLREGADVVTAYRRLLATVMMRSLGPNAADWGMELSGGLDSATLALCAADPGHMSMRTFGLEIEGSAALQQRARRTDIVKRINSVDCVFPASDSCPLSDVARGEWLGPHAEIYASAFDQLLRRASDREVKRMVNGVGGDELMLPHYSERREHPEVAEARPRASPSPSYITRDALQAYKTSYWNIGHAPRTLVPRSTLLSLASRAPVFLRRGIWPISPFASLDAVRFCRRLPAEWRNNKHLHRAVLAHSGCASTTVYPELHENFHSVLTEALRLKQYSLLRDLFAHSKLAAAGFVEKQKLLKAYDIYAKNGRLAGDERFYEVAVLELLLRGA